MKLIKTNMKPARFMNWLIVGAILCVALENVKLFDVFGAPLKPMHILMLLSVCFCFFFTEIRIRDLLIGLFFLVLPIFPLYRIGDPMEWFKSYVVYAIIAAFMMTSFRLFLRTMEEHKARYVKLFLSVIAVTQILGVVQFVCMNFFDYFFLENIWGIFQFHKSQYGMSRGFYRAYSLFLEPSFFAWVSNSAPAVALFVNKEILSLRFRLTYIILAVVAVFCTLSVSGLGVMLALLVVWALLRAKNLKQVLISAGIVAALLLIVVLCTDLLKPLRRIAIEIAAPGTSGYERLVTPFLYLGKTLENFPIFGRGLGQDGAVDAVGVIGRYASLQNGLFGIFVWMGLSALCIIVPALVYAFKRIRANKMWLLLLLGVIGIYVSTGAWCSLDTFLLLMLIVGIGSAVPAARKCTAPAVRELYEPTDETELISVIVPVYNKEKYLEKCLDSIVNQTYRNLEILLIDDGSTDGSAAICDAYAKKDPRVKSVHRKNAGPGATRNYGMLISSGRYIAFVDSDDWIERDMYARLMDAIRRNGASLAMCGRNMVFEESGEIQSAFCLEAEQCFDTHEAVRRFLVYDAVDASPCDKLFDRALLEGSPYATFPKKYVSEDIPFVFGLISRAEKTVHIGVPCYNYLQRSGSYSRGTLNKKAWGLKVYPDEVRRTVLKAYKDLQSEADYYYAINMMTLFFKVDKKKDAEAYRTIREELIRHKKQLLGKYTSMNQKMLYLLIKLNLYHTVRDLRRKLK